MTHHPPPQASARPATPRETLALRAPPLPASQSHSPRRRGGSAPCSDCNAPLSKNGGVDGRGGGEVDGNVSGGVLLADSDVVRANHTALRLGLASSHGSSARRSSFRDPGATSIGTAVSCYLEGGRGLCRGYEFDTTIGCTTKHTHPGPIHHARFLCTANSSASRG